MNADGGRRVILVVDDSVANQMLFEAVLRREGYVVKVASSAPEALASIQSGQPDLILMDIQLQGQDGLSLTRQLKADPEHSSIPVVAITAYAMVNDRKLSLEAGCVGYITKPIDTRKLASQIDGFLLAQP